MSDCKKLIFTLDEIKTMIEEYINSSSSGNSEIDYILSSFEAKILNDYDLKLQHKKNAELINKKLGSV